MMTTPPAPVTITLAVPTPFAVDTARLVAWLEGRGYSECTESWCSPRRLTFAKPRPAEPGRRYVIELPRDGVGSPMDHRDYLLDAIADAAEIEGLTPAALAALLAPPVEGPALQWAMMSERARSEVIARIADLAATDRKSVAILRADGCADQALEAEGDALGLEAAAAVLRGGAHG